MTELPFLLLLYKHSNCSNYCTANFKFQFTNFKFNKMASSSNSKSADPSRDSPLLPRGLEYSTNRILIDYFDAIVHALALTMTEEYNAKKTLDDAVAALAAIRIPDDEPLSKKPPSKKDLKVLSKMKYSIARDSLKLGSRVAKPKLKPKPISINSKINHLKNDYVDFFRDVREIVIMGDMTQEDAEKVVNAVAIANEQMQFDGVKISITFHPRMDPEKQKHLLDFCVGSGNFSYRVGEGSWINTFDDEDVLVGAVTGEDVAVGAVTGEDVAVGAVADEDVLVGAVTDEDVAVGAVADEDKDEDVADE